MSTVPGVSAPGRFVPRVLLWLPVCFGVWCFLSVLFTGPLAWLVDAAMTGLFPSVIEQIARKGNTLTVITHIVVSAPGNDAGTGTIPFELDPLKYGYCVPLYTALVLASALDDELAIGRWVVGMVLLLLVQVFGISTEILKVLAFEINDQARAMVGFSGWEYEGLALAYQLGYLILPPVAPIMIWFGQFQDVLGRLVPKSGHRHSNRLPPPPAGSP